MTSNSGKNKKGISKILPLVQKVSQKNKPGTDMYVCGWVETTYTHILDQLATIPVFMGIQKTSLTQGLSI